MINPFVINGPPHPDDIDNLRVERMLSVFTTDSRLLVTSKRHRYLTCIRAVNLKDVPNCARFSRCKQVAQNISLIHSPMPSQLPTDVQLLMHDYHFQSKHCTRDRTWYYWRLR